MCFAYVDYDPSLRYEMLENDPGDIAEMPQPNERRQIALQDWEDWEENHQRTDVDDSRNVAEEILRANLLVRDRQTNNAYIPRNRTGGVQEESQDQSEDEDGEEGGDENAGRITSDGVVQGDSGDEESYDMDYESSSSSARPSYLTSGESCRVTSPEGAKAYVRDIQAILNSNSEDSSDAEVLRYRKKLPTKRRNSYINRKAQEPLERFSAMSTSDEAELLNGTCQEYYLHLSMSKRLRLELAGTKRKKRFAKPATAMTRRRKNKDILKLRIFEQPRKEKRVFTYCGDSDEFADDELEEPYQSDQSTVKGMQHYDKCFPENTPFFETFYNGSASNIFATTKYSRAYNVTLDVAAVFDPDDVRVSKVKSLGNHWMDLARRGLRSDEVLGMPIKSKRSPVRMRMVDYFLMNVFDMTMDEIRTQFEKDEDEFEYKRVWRKLFYIMDGYKASEWNKFKVLCRFFTNADPPVSFEKRVLIKKKLMKFQEQPGPLSNEQLSKLQYICHNRNILTAISTKVLETLPDPPRLTSKLMILKSTFFSTLDRRLLYRVLYYPEAMICLREERTDIMNDVYDTLLKWSRSMCQNPANFADIQRYKDFYTEMRQDMMIECKPLTWQIIFNERIPVPEVPAAHAPVDSNVDVEGYKRGPVRARKRRRGRWKSQSSST